MFRKLLQKFMSDPGALLNLLEILRVYHDKNDALLSLIEDIFVAGITSENVTDDQKKDMFYKGYRALTEVGVKSGTPGKPFQVDLDLKDLLERRLSDVSPDSPFYSPLTNAINSVKQNIESSFDKENETW